MDGHTNALTWIRFYLEVEEALEVAEYGDRLVVDAP